MNIDEMTVGQLKEIRNLLNLSGSQCSKNRYEFKIGQKVCIRGVTMIYTGIIEEDYEDFIVLSSACWIADSGKWSEFLKDPAKNVNEAEMYPKNEKIPISKGVITDVCVLDHVVLETK